MKQHEQALQFLKKAAEDEALLDEVLTSPRVSDVTLGFHCQQAAEKMLKALLSELGVRFRRTHDLQELLQHLEDAGHPLPDSLCVVVVYSPYAVTFRYEDEPLDQPLDRPAAREILRQLRRHVESAVHAQH